ncbi:MAG: hypothetical protein KatS3mg124_1895 [Porticoccaceae bacterium]|nr:MAG: hypothetical protein KatS3mg124_1895 [Porticoccaceae bacterium]
MRRALFVTAVGLTALLTACSFVKVSEAGKRVQMRTSAEVQHCKRLGTVSSSVVDRILFIPRNRQKVQEDLDKLARDQAVIMGANTLVHVATRDGVADYIAYQCP